MQYIGMLKQIENKYMKNYDKNTEYNSTACSSAELSYLRCK